MSRARGAVASARARLRGAESRIPLQARLLLIVVVILLVATTAFALVSMSLLRANLQSQVDDELQEKGVSAVESALPSLSQGAGKAEYYASFYVLLATAEGTTITERCAFGTYDAGSCTHRPDLPDLSRQFVADQAGRPFTATDSGSGQDWRVLTFTVASAGIDVAVALPLENTHEAVSQYRTVAVLGGISVLLIGTALAALAIRRSFRPLGDIERTASAIASGDLSRRVPEAPVSTEIGRLSAALNTMLTQIEASFRSRQRSEEQMRRFVADASHELRTPLAAIRGFAELYRQGAVREPADVAHVMERIEGESTRLGRLVEDLLALARLDEEQRRRAAAHAPVDLAVVASDAVHDARGLAPERAVRLVGLAPDGGPGPAVVDGDEAGMRQVLTNLLANALHHTPAGTPVEVAVGRVNGPSGPESVVEVRDHGPGLSAEEADKVFERFYRVDASRRRGTGGGSGLGLAIVATIVAGHGGTVAVAPTDGGGATFRVRFRALAGPTEDDTILDDDPDDPLDGEGVHS